MVKGILLSEQVRVRVWLPAWDWKSRARQWISPMALSLNGIIHIGEKQFGGGRAGEKAAHRNNCDNSVELGFECRSDEDRHPATARWPDYQLWSRGLQPGDDAPGKFSYSDLHLLWTKCPATLPLLPLRKFMIHYEPDLTGHRCSMAEYRDWGPGIALPSKMRSMDSRQGPPSAVHRTGRSKHL